MLGVNGRLRRLAAALRDADQPDLGRAEHAGAALSTAVAAALSSKAEKLKNFDNERQWNQMFGDGKVAEGDFFTSPDQGKVDGPYALSLCRHI